MPMWIAIQRLLKSPPSRGQFRGRTYTDALSGSNLGWIGTVERFEISESSWASTGGFSQLIILKRVGFKFNVRDSGLAPAEGGAYASQSKTGGAGRVLCHSHTACLAEPRVPEQLLHATMDRRTLLARPMATQRNTGWIRDGTIGRLDFGYLARKTIKGTEDPRRPEEDRLIRSRENESA